MNAKALERSLKKEVGLYADLLEKCNEYLQTDVLKDVIELAKAVSEKFPRVDVLNLSVAVSHARESLTSLDISYLDPVQLSSLQNALVIMERLDGPIRQLSYHTSN